MIVCDRATTTHLQWSVQMVNQYAKFGKLRLVTVQTLSNKTLDGEYCVQASSHMYCRQLQTLKQWSWHSSLLQNRAYKKRCNCRQSTKMLNKRMNGSYSCNYILYRKHIILSNETCRYDVCGKRNRELSLCVVQNQPTIMKNITVNHALRDLVCFCLAWHENIHLSR